MGKKSEEKHRRYQKNECQFKTHLRRKHSEECLAGVALIQVIGFPRNFFKITCRLVQVDGRFHVAHDVVCLRLQETNLFIENEKNEEWEEVEGK